MILRVRITHWKDQNKEMRAAVLQLSSVVAAPTSTLKAVPAQLGLRYVGLFWSRRRRLLPFIGLDLTYSVTLSLRTPLT